MGALQKAEFVGDPFLANTPAGGSRDRAIPRQLSVWFASLEMNCEKLKISNVAAPGHSLGEMEAKQ